MLSYISNKSVELLVNKGIIAIERKNVYFYGFQVLYSNMMCISAIMMLGYLQKHLIPSVIFLVLFSGLRTKVGGYHASTYGMCFLSTILAYEIYILIAGFINGNIFLQYVLLLSSLLMIYLHAPVGSKYKSWDEKQKKESKRSIKKHIVCIGILSIFACSCCKWDYITYIISCITVICGMMLVTIAKGGKEV